MKKRILGNGLEVSAVGLGCMGFSHAYGEPVEKTIAINTIRQSFSMGYTFFDTAECYLGVFPDGSISCNEELVGEALKDHRKEVQIATKFGVSHEGRQLIINSRPDNIRRTVEASLNKLGTDYIDLYYQHRPDPDVPIAEVAGIMSELIKEGKILHWGMSEADEPLIRAAAAVCKPACVQNRYSIMARWHEKLFPVLEELNIGFVAFSPLANGILTTAYRSDDRFAAADYRSVMPQYQDDAYEKNAALFDLIRNRTQAKNATPAQLSLAWMLAKKPYLVPIPGSRKPERIAENAGSPDVTLTGEEVAAIDHALEKIAMSEVFGGSAVKRPN